MSNIIREISIQQDNQTQASIVLVKHAAGKKARVYYPTSASMGRLQYLLYQCPQYFNGWYRYSSKSREDNRP